MSSLRRVSSRQRLVSWDAFDATVYYDSTEEEDEEDEVGGGNDTRQSRVVVSSTNPASPQATTTSPISHPTTTIDGTSHMLRSDRHNTNVEYGSLNKNNVDTVVVVVVNEDSSDTEDSGVDVTRKRRLYDTTSTTSSSTTNGNTTTLPSHSHRTSSNTIQERHDDHHYLHVIPASPIPSPTTTSATTTTTSTHTYYAPYSDATTAGTSPTTMGEVLLWQLPLEVQCMMYQYLNVKELRTVTQVCTTLRHSLLLLLPHPDHMHHNDDDDGIETEDEERNCIVESALWRPLCIHQFWPFLQPSPSSSSSDALPPSQSPLILSITPRSHSPYHHHHPSITRNYPLLLSMAVSKIPTHIDTSLFPYTRPSRSATRSGHLQVLAELLESQTFTIAPMPQPMSLQPKMISMNCTITTTTTTTSNHNSSSIATLHEDCRQQNHQVIQFIGKVGFGDQCIRSNAPLPRPKRIQSPTPTSYTTSTTTKWNLPYHPFHPSTTSSTTSSLFQRVFRNSSHGSGMNSTGTTNNTTAATATMLRENSIGTQNTTTTTGSTSLFCPLRRSVRIAARRESASPSSASYSSATATRVPRTMTIPYRPFCVPFMTSNYEINIAPRYIAYYEVTILPKCNHGDKCETTTATIQHIRSTNGQQTTITKSIQYPPDTSATTTTNHRHGTATLPPNHHNRNNITSTVSDCVAVGIGTENFPLQHRMPGWDSHSYGYHGDDGGIFHGNGSMIQPYHRPFGVNDTIGCGIDYIQNSIFFTLNGIFLGYAFPLLPKHRDIDLYPMIGMDTQYPILCNFGGTAPFVFDLPSMIQQHDTIIQEQLTI